MIKDAIDLAPMDVKFDINGTRIAASSLDGSLKIYDLLTHSNELTSANLLLDSNNMSS